MGIRGYLPALKRLVNVTSRQNPPPINASEHGLQISNHYSTIMRAMSDKHSLKLRPADQARTDFALIEDPTRAMHAAPCCLAMAARLGAARRRLADPMVPPGRKPKPLLPLL
jgi:hypothetical protein